MKKQSKGLMRDDTIGPKEVENVDQHIPEVDTLDLPEDIETR